MQPTVRSQATLRRLVWLLSLLLALTVTGGGIHGLRLNMEIEAVEVAAESAQRELIAAEKARADLEARLKAAEAARAETEAKLNRMRDKK
jgi:hypothetical protein